MRNIIFTLYKFSLLILFLQSMFAWFLWGQLIFALLISFSFSILFFLYSSDIVSIRKSTIIPLVFLVLVQLYVVRDGNTNALISALLRIVVISGILLLKDEIKLELFNFFTKSFAVILAVSIFAWILFLFGVRLPNYSTDFNNGQYYFDNYYLFLDNRDPYVTIKRFSGVFLEPGQLGMITSFLLFANRFELKRKSVLIIFVANLMTFSLVAYVLLLFSASLYILLHSKKPVLYILLWSLLLYAANSFFTKYNNGNNVVNQLIIHRVQYKDGELAGNNRFSKGMDDQFEYFLKNDNLFLGEGVSNYQMMDLGANAGYKVYLLQHGIIGTLFTFLFYLFLVLSNKNKMAWILLILYILTFLQAAYPLWECELLIFITSLSVFSSRETEDYV